jgi:hypothetical protein
MDRVYIRNLDHIATFVVLAVCIGISAGDGVMSPRLVPRVLARIVELHKSKVVVRVGVAELERLAVVMA